MKVADAQSVAFTALLLTGLSHTAGILSDIEFVDELESCDGDTTVMLVSGSDGQKFRVTVEYLGGAA